MPAHYFKVLYEQDGNVPSRPISKAQKYSRNKYWEHLEKNFFSKKNTFFKTSHKGEKLKKRPFRLIKRFYKRKTSKKCKGYPLTEFEKFRKKVIFILPKKTQRGTLWSRLYFWKLKKYCGSARESNTISCFSEI